MHPEDNFSNESNRQKFIVRQIGPWPVPENLLDKEFLFEHIESCSPFHHDGKSYTWWRIVGGECVGQPIAEILLEPV